MCKVQVGSLSLYLYNLVNFSYLPLSLSENIGLGSLLRETSKFLGAPPSTVMFSINDLLSSSESGFSFSV